MSFYQRFAGAWRMPQWLHVDESFQDGFFAGVALFLVLFLLLLLVKRLVGGSKSAHGVTVKGPMGKLFVTTNAVREFVARILEDFDGLRLRGLKLRTSGNRVTLILEVGVTSGEGLPALRDAVQGRVISEAEEKLGLVQPPKVDLRVRSLNLGHREGLPARDEVLVSSRIAPALSEESDEHATN